LNNLEDVHFDFYREKLLKKYRNSTEYILDEFAREFNKKGS